MFVCKAVYWLLLAVACVAQEYVIDDSVGRGRRFDGVGAISGGGVRVSDVNSIKHGWMTGVSWALLVYMQNCQPTLLVINRS